MKTRTRLLVPIAIAVGLVLFLASVYPALWPAVAQAKPGTNQALGKVDRFSISGESAVAQWAIADEEQQNFAEVFISLVDSATKADGHLTQSFIDVAISQYNRVEVCDQYGGEEECYYEYDYVLAFFGFAELDKSDFKISNNLQSATAQDIEIIGYDYFSGEEMTIMVDAVWTGEGPLTKSKDSFSEYDESFKYTFKFTGASRDADATATVTGDIELQLDDALYNDASLTKIKEGTMVRFIGKPPANGPPSSPGGMQGWKSLIAPIQELQGNVAGLEAQIDSLEERVADLEERLDGGGPSGQNIFVETDEIEYNVGDDVEIVGTIEDTTEETEVNVEITAPDGGSDDEAIDIDDDNDFELLYELSDGADDGVYTVRAQYDAWASYTYFIVDEDQDLVEIELDDDFYRPGNTVELFGVVIDPQTGVDEVEMTVLDPDGDAIVDEESVDLDSSDEFEFDLDDDAPVGRYAVTAVYDGEEVGWAIFEVSGTAGGGAQIIAQLADATLSKGDEVVITGSIEEDDVDLEEVSLEVENPDGEVIEDDGVRPENDGSFEFRFDLEDDAETGTYEVILRYVGYEDKTLTFTVTN